jgi:short-subunit dehydrogenase
MPSNGRQKAQAEQSKRGCALISGASAGIGAEFARAFAAKGYDLVLVARSRDKLGEIAREIEGVHGVRVRIMPADLSLAAMPQALCDGLREKRIDIEVLVNNAGVVFEGDFADVTLDDHIRLLQINIVALTSLTRLLLPHMLQRHKGRILNVASTAAFMPIPRVATYAAAKAYVLSFTEALSEELRGTGVTATALCPGFTQTSMLSGSRLARWVPSMIVMSASAVAKEGCNACLRGETILVPGIANDIVARGVQYLPRMLVRAVGGFVTGRGA